jgi:DNA mismatch repair protein MSH2
MDEVITQIEDREKLVLLEIADEVISYAYPVKQLSDVISLLDVVVSLAVAAVTASPPYVKPEILDSGSGVLCFSQLRHPCLEVTSDNFVANDVEMRDETQKFLLITGRFIDFV